MYRLDCVGDICPVPMIKTKKALAEGHSDGLEIVVDNDIAVQNISKLLNAQGCSFSVAKEGEHFFVRVGDGILDVPPTNVGANCVRPPLDSASTPMVVISSETMGTGDDTLGKILIKGFIFALTQLDTLPATIIFYNGGVRHALKTSESLADLQYLQENGVEILVCGTCLNHFGVAEQLAVGEVSNMYEIVTHMQAASCIMQP